MWDSNSPMQLLQSMPKKLTKENLEKLQLVLDADKYKNSLVSGFDLCGMYAPFCRGCQKTSIYPCAIAYVNMMRVNGMDVEIDARPVLAQDNIAVEEQQPVAEPEVRVEESVISEPEELPVAEELPEPVTEAPVCAAEQPVVSTEKRKIRIAVARKKLY